MDAFQHIFGITQDKIKRNCVIVPFLPNATAKALNIDKLTKGNIYACGQTEHFTVILGKMGPAFIGDAVLHLKDTQVENLFFIGSCGLTHNSSDLTIGSVVVPQRVFSYDSFTQLLSDDVTNPPVFPANDAFVQTLSKSPNLTPVTAASVNSLYLETQYKPHFEEKDITVLDMETAAFYQAAASIQKKAVALLYVTDIIENQPYYRNLTPADQDAIQAAQEQTAESIKKLILKI